MNILHIFQALTGDAASIGIPATMFFAVIFGIYFFGAKKDAQKVGGVWWKQVMARPLPVIVAFWIGALALIWSDYRPYNPKKDGVPKVQTDSTRIPAEELIKMKQKADSLK